MSKSKITTTLAGQPNCGKSTIFNMLTGAKQHIANYPGITVDKKVGYIKTKDHSIEVVDLPGTYSLTSYTQEEVVARNFIIDEEPDVILNVLDASNLEKSLYLTFQLIEMGKPMVIVMNMMDVAKGLGYELDSSKISKILGLPVIEVTARKNIGKEEIEESIKEVFENKEKGLTGYKVNYIGLESKIEEISKKIKEKSFEYAEKINSRWIALKLIENDKIVMDEIENNSKRPEVSKISKDFKKDYFKEKKEKIQQAVASSRYLTSGEIFERCVKKTKEEKERITDKVDNILCHKILGPTFLIFFMYLFFQSVIMGDALIQPYWQKIIGTLRDWIVTSIPTDSLINDGILRTLVGENMIKGAFSLLSYIPMFFILFTLIGIMEDTGYMSRIAFLMDKLLKAFGLHGQSALPMLLGGVGMGGCAIPGIMATRGMKDERAKLVTRLIIPILNCGAKIPFYLMITAAFFKEKAGIVLIIFYLIMFIIVLLVAKLLDMFVVSEERSPFIVELPSYHIPSTKLIISGAINKLIMFLKKIIQVIVPFMAIMWLVTSVPGLSEKQEDIFQERYKKVNEMFEKKIGNENNYLEYFNNEKSRAEYIKYSNKLKKKIRVIKNTKTKKTRKLDNEFKKENEIYFEAMALNSLENIDDQENYQKYIDQYLEELKPIENEFILRLSKFSEKELLKNPIFYKIASNGKIYLEKEKLIKLKKINKKYQSSIKKGELESKINEEFKKGNELYFNIIKDSKVKVKSNYILDKDAKKLENNFSKILLKKSLKIKQERKEILIKNSFGGKFSRFLEPVSKLAGFDWKINLAFVSTFAAKENFIAVITGLFGISIGDNNQLVGSSWTMLNGICMMIALALFPPCLPTLILIKTETGKVRWMVFVMIYPIVLGFVLATLTYQIGMFFKLGI